METPTARALSQPRTRALRESLALALRRYAERDGRGYPDWAVRYMPIVRRLRLDRATSARILEIGANENGLSRFTWLGHPGQAAHGLEARATSHGHPGRMPIITVDLAVPHLEAARAAGNVLPVAADFAHLPFRDNAFDIIVSADTLEHVPSSTRPNALHELTRVLAHSGRAAISFPTGDAASHAESEIAAAYHRSTGRTLRWLDEHAEHGLPAADSVTEALASSNHRVSVAANANVRLWKIMWRILLNTWPTRGNALAQVLLRLSTPILTRAHGGRCYRAIVWLEPHDD